MFIEEQRSLLQVILDGLLDIHLLFMAPLWEVQQQYYLKESLLEHQMLEHFGESLPNMNAIVFMLLQQLFESSRKWIIKENLWKSMIFQN